jgi:protease-4
MKKHPVLFSLSLIVLIMAVMCAAVIAMLYLAGDDSGVPFGDQVALLEIRGVITDGKPVTDLLARYKEDKDIKAIIIRIESPGGGVAPSQEIFTELTRIRDQKPVVAYLGNVAASGGYYVAAGASKIVSSPGSLTGSIGVVIQLSNVEHLFEKLGLDFSTIKAGKYKDIGSPYREMTEEERQLLQNVINDVHEQFISDVAKGRNLPDGQVRAIADGRIMTGLQAKELGLVDEMGNFEDAMRIAKSLAGIEGEVSVVRPTRKRHSLMEFLLDEFLDGLAERLGINSPRLLALF